VLDILDIQRTSSVSGHDSIEDIQDIQMLRLSSVLRGGVCVYSFVRVKLQMTAVEVTFIIFKIITEFEN